MRPPEAIPVLRKLTHGQDGFQRASSVSQLRNSQQGVQHILFNRRFHTPLLEHALEHDGAANHKHLVVLVGLVRPPDVDMCIELQLINELLTSRVIGAEDTQRESDL